MWAKWKRLGEPVVVLTVLGSAGTFLGAAEGVPPWVAILVGTLVAAVGAATRAIVTPEKNLP